ncbi:hypothetical protein GYMLUDRAFT_36267 [Collybiopsis luxurians FD-317 M1]|nr:hypothetical protein GYMLUDRAFT_36267 [Collybiopsis luxurians FD-317 M1]
MIPSFRFHVYSLLHLLPFLVVLLTTNFSSVYASPVTQASSSSSTFDDWKKTHFKLGQITKDDEFFGARWVRGDVAKEYDDKGTLTQVPANGLTLGEGAYLSPGATELPPSHVVDPWICIAWVNKATIRKEDTPKYFADDMARPKIKAGLEKAKLPEFGNTIIFSYFRTPGMQAVIPPPFLEPSEKFHYADKNRSQPAPGKNSLGIKIVCIPLAEFKTLKGNEEKIWKQTAKWQDMGIVNWPAGAKTS